MQPFFVIIFVIAIFTIIIVAKGIIIVQQAETMIIERLGKYNRTLESGVNIIIPIFEQPRKVHWRYVKTDVSGENKIILTKETAKIDLRETVYDFPKQNVITKDNVMIEINALLYFQVTDPVKSMYEIANLPDAIEKLTQTNLRNVVGELDLDECLSSRDTINKKLSTILDDATDKWGVKVNRVELQDINPPKDVQEEMEKQMRAERSRRAAILQAEGQKRAAILEAEGLKEASINKAEGEKRATILKAEGDAEARIKVAEGEAEAILKITGAISQSKADPATYLIAIKYIESLTEIMNGKENKVILLPYEATALISSIGGIQEMLKGIK
ncbi:MAG: paraslipin [Desulfobacterales bacterium]|nr:paraslipin [Desulfobacterales bacterium]